MQPVLHEPQSLSPKVKNILIRSFNADRQDNSFSPEASHILKYSPKYYQNLAVEVRPFHPLLSKIKKIKKLKKFEGRTGGSFKEVFPQNLWFNLLANLRKEIEEAPQILPNDPSVNLKRSFWRSVNLQKIKFFPNVTRVLLSRWRIEPTLDNSDPFVTVPECFVGYIWNLRRLRSLEVLVMKDNYELAKWVFEKLNRRRRLFERLEDLIIRIVDVDMNTQSLLQNKELLSHVTDLSLCVPFDPALVEIPLICKNLKSLSLEFTNNGEKPEFVDFFTSMQGLQQLKSLRLVWPRLARTFWSHFKPQSSIRHLNLKFSVAELINEGLFGENVEPKDVVAHWEDIPELDVLTFHVTCNLAEDMVFARQFMTMILKKVQKIRSLNYQMIGFHVVRDEPFFVEEVPHLYESLERFEHSLWDWSSRQEPAKFDLKMMRPFKNLKELKLDGGTVVYENVEEVVSLLEENQQKAALQIKVNLMLDQDWLGDTLRKIERVKREDTDLEMLIDIRFKTKSLFGLLGRLCQDIQAVKAVKGLLISLTLQDDEDFSLPSVERVREVLKKNHEVHNLTIVLYNASGLLVFSKMDGEKEQFEIHRFH